MSRAVDSIYMAWEVYLVLAAFVVAGTCPNIFPSHLLSECDMNSVRTAIYYWDNCTDPLPVPTSNLPCDLDCQAGFYLGLSDLTKQSSCLECPKNTYSEGGAVYYFPGKWSDFQDRFNSQCYWNYGTRISVSEQCPYWDLDSQNQVLVTGKGVDEVSYESVLEGNFHLVKRGKVHLKYRYFGAYWGNKETARFALTIKGDTQVVTEEYSHQVAPWTEIVKILEPGDYKIELSFKFLFISEANTHAELEFLTITGTEMSDFACISCAEGTYSHPGSSSCYGCPVNSYYDVGAETCTGCAGTRYSPAGSVGENACLPMSKCSARDYTVEFTPCREGKRTKSFQWVQPQICDPAGAEPLPPDSEVQCEMCLPGHYHALISSTERQCKPCKDGSYSTALGYSESCSVCEAGHFAAKSLNYTVWSPFPTEIANECRKKSGAKCAFNSGWVASLYALTTGRIHENQVELVLTRYVNIIHKAATVTFAYTLDDGGQGARLEFLIDNRITKEFKHNQAVAESGAIPISIGYHKLSWVYYHPGVGSDIAYIHYIAVEGADEGGAASCLPCPAGYWSEQEKTICTPCQPGYSSAPGARECVRCNEGEYSPTSGSLCLPCPSNTQSNSLRTSCISPPVLSFGTTEVPLYTLFSCSQSPVFGASAQSKLFTKDTFYGPIVSPKGRKYYLSVLNPAKLELVEHISLDEQPYGYAYGLFNSKSVDFARTITSENEFYCIKEDEDVLVNLGSKVSSIQYSGDVVISYTQGGQCNAQGALFTSEVVLKCNSRKRDSWPVVTAESSCQVQFTWETRYACPVCEHEETHMKESSCAEGKKLVTLLEPPTCVLLDVDREWWEGCNEVMEILGKWQTYVALGVLFLVLSLTVLLTYCYCQVKHNYSRLREVKGYRESS